MNEGLGGTIEFGEEGYLFRRDLPAGKVRQILEDDQDAQIYGSQLPQFGVDAGDGIRYDLIHLDENEPVDAIAVYDVDEGQALDFYDIDDIAEGWKQ